MPAEQKKSFVEDLQEAIADAVEMAHHGVHIGEVTVLKSVAGITKRLMRIRKPEYIVAKIEVAQLPGKHRQQLQDAGWSHLFPFQDALAVGSLASVIGLFTGGIGWIAGGFAAGLTAISAERLPHWMIWESLSGSFDYDAIAQDLIEANRILLKDNLTVLRIDPISEDDLKQKKREQAKT